MLAVQIDQNIHLINIYAFGRHLYPKRQTLYSKYKFDQFMQSQGIKTQFAQIFKLGRQCEPLSTALNQHSYAYRLTCKTFAYSLTFASSARTVKQQQGQAPLIIIKCSMWIQGSQGLQRLTSGHQVQLPSGLDDASLKCGKAN